MIAAPVLVEVADLEEASDIARMMESKMREGTAGADTTHVRVLAATITVTPEDLSE